MKTQDDHQCVKWAFAMRAVVLPWRLGYQMIANGCSIQYGMYHDVVPHGGPFLGENEPFLSRVSGPSSSPWRHISKASGLSSTVISNALRKTRTQLGPSSSLDLKNCYWSVHLPRSLINLRVAQTAMQLSEFRLVGIKRPGWYIILLIVFCLPSRPRRCLSSSIWMTFCLWNHVVMSRIWPAGLPQPWSTLATLSA